MGWARAARRLARISTSSHTLTAMEDDVYPDDAYLDGSSRDAVSPDRPVTIFADDRRIESLSIYTDRLDELVSVFHDASADDGQLLDRRPASDSWSVSEVLHHLADAEMHQSLRLREMLAVDRPSWSDWDEATYATVLGYETRPAGDAVTLILSVRNVNSRLLAILSPEQWNRTAIHPNRGEVDVAAWVQICHDHLAGHVLQARRAIVGMI